MDINELRVKRQELELNILKFVSDAVINFKRETGLSPSAVSINLVDITAVLDREKNQAVGSVKVRVEL